MKKIYEHRVPDDFDRSLSLHVSAVAVRIVCDAPGIASVSHVLGWSEWRELVATVDASWPEAGLS